MTNGRASVPAASDSIIRGLAVCPSCRGELKWGPEVVNCRRCAVLYEIIDGIPILVGDRSLVSHDDFEHQHSTDHKQRQSEFFDRYEAVEFEITRPRDSPPLYEWLILEKFRRSMIGIDPPSREPILAVCAGSGMDADYLARAGAPVIAADISLGAARRCRDRATRYNLNLVPIVADVEHLPFRDRSIDLVYVHDGLHHLENPMTGLAEMARVASRALSLTEPAAAGLTAVATRIGVALEYEDAGNRVARLRQADATRILTENGFAVVHASRYAMYYRHRPGRLFRSLSTGPLFPATKVAFALANRVAGRLGNKLSIQAVRADG
jgi:SAM-dependent methyltransferase/uncharacterized protein YbaR (Trm112 family)